MRFSAPPDCESSHEKTFLSRGPIITNLQGLFLNLHWYFRTVLDAELPDKLRPNSAIGLNTSNISFLVDRVAWNNFNRFVMIKVKSISESVLVNRLP